MTCLVRLSRNRGTRNRGQGPPHFPQLVQSARTQPLVWYILNAYSMHTHRRTGQHPFGGADQALPEWIRWGGGSSRHFSGSIFNRDPYSNFPRPIRWGVVAELFPLTAVTDPKFVLFKHHLTCIIVFCPYNVDSLPECMSINCPNWGGGQLPPPPVPYAYVHSYDI